MPRPKRSKPKLASKPEMVPTTIRLPRDLKLAARKLALDTGTDLQDLVADGLRYVIGKAGAR